MTNRYLPRKIRLAKKLLQRHTRSENVKIGPYLNQTIWSRGRKNPPNKIQIEITKKEDYFLAEIVGAPKTEEIKKKEKKKETKTSDEKPKELRKPKEETKTIEEKLKEAEKPKEEMKIKEEKSKP